MKDRSENDILIVGTGALACLFASRISSSGGEVTMLGTWREGLAALRMHGVTIVQPDGSQTSYPVTVADRVEACTPSKYALVLVKSWQTERAAQQLATCLSHDGLALTLQNGLGNYETLAAHLGAVRTAQGVTTTGSTLLSSGRVRPGGEGIVSIGAHSHLSPITDILHLAGFQLEILENVQSLIWGKLVVNAAINPLTALLMMDNGGIISRPTARMLSAELAQEVAAVARAQGIPLPHKDPVQIAEDVARKTSSNYSSMYQDILRGAPTEIDSICGAVVKAGAQAGVQTPVNETVWKLIHALVEGNQSDEIISTKKRNK
jgi:2-dehydropantoate 2-reductase